MRNIYVIGTLHGGYVPTEELEEQLVKLDPSQLFIELPDKSIETIKSGGDVRDEMMFVYEWGHKHNIPVHCFDVDRWTLKEGITINSPEFKELYDAQSKILEKHKLSWKELNKEKYDTLLDHPLMEKVSDSTKEHEREIEMLQNIRDNMKKQGNILIFTGTAHLSFFQESLSKAIFPFRD